MAKSFIARRLEQLPTVGTTISFCHPRGSLFISNVHMAGHVFTRVTPVDGAPRHFQGAVSIAEAALAFYDLAEAIEP